MSLELGGKSPAIVFPDADIDGAISGTASAIFYNQGQCCTAGSRLFAHKSVYDRVVEGVSAEAGKIKIGHGLDPDVNLGPLVSKEQHERVRGFLESGRKEGAEVVTGGNVPGNQGYFVEPTVLANTNRDMRVVREEIFGPVVCVQSFDDDDLEAVAKFANDTEYGLQASVWTRDLKVAHMMARKIKAGTICINTHNYGDPAWPFGGYKQSGWGREMGKEVMEHYTETKAIAAQALEQPRTQPRMVPAASWAALARASAAARTAQPPGGRVSRWRSPQSRMIGDESERTSLPPRSDGIRPWAERGRNLRAIGSGFGPAPSTRGPCARGARFPGFPSRR